MSTLGIKVLDRPSIILLVGRPASGKTTALKAIIHQIVKMKKPSFGRFYVSTKWSGDFDFAPDGDIFEDYTQDHLEQYVLKIKQWKKKNPKKTVPQNL
jgi:uridine kinase